MATLECAILCEQTEMNQDGSVRSINEILWPSRGFGVRSLPFTCQVAVVFSLKGLPKEMVTLTTTIGSDVDAPLTFPLPEDGQGVITFRKVEFVSSGVVTFGLLLNGKPAFVSRLAVEAQGPNVRNSE
jgi:hypothetical protein